MNYKKNDRIKAKGFVVRVFDSLNFDIDFILDSETESLYDSVTKNTYRYVDYYGKEHISRSFRCRLDGVGVNKDTQDKRFAYRDHVRSSHIVNLFDGWIDCYISDIDVYGRLLIDYAPFKEVIDRRPGYFIYNPNNLADHNGRKMYIMDDETIPQTVPKIRKNQVTYSPMNRVAVGSDFFG